MLAASKIIHDPQLHIRDPLLRMPSHDTAAAELAAKHPDQGSVLHSVY